jgi:hypothetical protein
MSRWQSHWPNIQVGTSKENRPQIKHSHFSMTIIFPSKISKDRLFWLSRSSEYLVSDVGYFCLSGVNNQFFLPIHHF